MWLLLVTILLGLMTLLYFKIKYHFGYWERLSVPHEKPKLITGNMIGVGRTIHFSEMLQRVYTEFKGQAPIAGMFFFFRKVAMVLDLDLAKLIITSNFKDFHDRGTYSNVKDDPLTGNLVHLEGAQWKAMRDKLTQVFTGAKIRGMLPCIIKISENLIKVYETMSNEDLEHKVDVTELNARYTTDVIGSCAFGLECNSLQNPDAEFRAKGKEFFASPRHSRFVRVFVSTNRNLARKLHIKTYPDNITEFFLDCVKQTIDYRLKNNVKRDDLMDIMISLKAANSSANKSDEGIDLSHGLTLEQIAAQAFVFFIAGFNSTSLTLSYCLYELVKNPEIQDRLREEIFEYLDKNNGNINFEMIKEMPYMDLVLAETLRIYPIITTILRRAERDFQIPDTNIVIEKGVSVLVPTIAIHRDPDIYPEPEEFIPERFTKEKMSERHQYCYLPFGEGPRKCIGIVNANMQIKVALITLLSHFKFSKSSLTPERVELSKSGFDLLPNGPLYLHVEKIKSLN